MNVLNKQWVPPLVNGDHLTVAEFMRRYEAMPDLKKAELINGVVYMSSPFCSELIEGVVSMGSPVSVEHSEPYAALSTWLGMYWAATPGTQMLTDTTVLMKVGPNTPQPDLLLRIQAGGQSKLSKPKSGRRFVEGAPELSVEIASSSASYDMHEKLEAYERNGVQEYLVWDVENKEVHWFALRGGKFKELPSTQEVFKSKVFPGLWLDSAALAHVELPAMLQCLQEGLATPEHQRFVAKLAKK